MAATQCIGVSPRFAKGVGRVYTPFMPPSLSHQSPSQGLSSSTPKTMKAHHNPLRHPCPTITELRQQVRDAEPEQRTRLLHSVKALMHIADAWQILLRGGEAHMARVVDRVARELFPGSWVGVAVEMFVMNTSPPPPQTGRKVLDAVKETSTEPPNEPDDDYSEAVDGAEWHLSRAWDLLDSLDDDASKTKAESVRSLGVAQIGEAWFREAMVDARVKRFRRMEKMGRVDAPE